MAGIQEASFGDEFSSTSVLKTLQDRLKAEGKLAVDVDSSLIPFLSTDKTTKLNDDETREIKDTAAQMCGPSDQTCLELKTQELADAKLKEKEKATETTANIVKGRRLRIKYTDSSGQSHTAIVPEGQIFELDGNGEPPKTEPSVDFEKTIGPWKEFFSSIWGVVGTTIFTFLFAASIIITWMTFRKYTRIIAIAMTAIACFIPLSGFGLSVVVPAAIEFFQKDKLQRLKMTVAEELPQA